MKMRTFLGKITWLDHFHVGGALNALVASAYRQKVSATRGLATSTYRQKMCVTRGLATSASNPKVCVVGGGPAGFYTAQHLIRASRGDVQVDIYERLPVPFGLVRYGVAPDHPEVKNVAGALARTARHTRCAFRGNVDVGRDVSVAELRRAYHAVVLCSGADRSRAMGVPGEGLRGVYSAKDFVGWYNGLPASGRLSPSLGHETAVVVGHGNVALDVARILLSPIDVLRKTDIARRALDALAESRVRRVLLVGRRGPMQAAFTIKELREMLKLDGARPQMAPVDFRGVAEALGEAAVPRPRKRLAELMLKTATQGQERHDGEGADNDARIWALRFFRSPVEVLPSGPDPARAGGIRLAVNRLEGSGDGARAIPTGQTEDVDCGLVVASVGYGGVPVDVSVPFDRCGAVVPSSAGRVLRACPSAGLYCSGWLKTGAGAGAIAATVLDSAETARSLLEDVASGALDVTAAKPGWRGIAGLLEGRGVKPVTFSDWERIDKEEIRRGQATGKAREKLLDVEEMLRVAHGAA